MEVDRSCPGDKESWQNLTEGLPVAWKLHRSWRKVSRRHGMMTRMTEDHLTAQKVDRIWRKVYRLHGILTEFDGRSPGCTESWPNLTEGLSAAGTVDGRSPDCTESWQNLMEGLPATENIDRSSHKVSWLPGKLMEGLQSTRKVDGNKLTVSRPFRKLTEVDGRCTGCKKYCRKLI